MSKRPARGASSALLALLLVLLGGLLTACAEEDSEGPEAGVTLQRVADEAELDTLLGRTITVSGEVDRVIDDRSFVLGEELDEQLPVITREPIDRTLVEEGRLLRVTGTVDELVVAEAEAELDLDFEDDELDEFEEQNYLIADAVEPAPEESE